MKAIGARSRTRILGAGFDVVEAPRVAGRARVAEVYAQGHVAAVARLRIRGRRIVECLVSVAPCPPTPGRPRAARGLSLRGLAQPLARMLAPARLVRIVVERRGRITVRVQGPRERTIARAFVRMSGNAPRRLDRASISRLGIPDDYGLQRGLARMREPGCLGFAGVDIHGREQWLAPDAARAWQRMQHAAAQHGIELALVSAFRSIAYQVGIVQRKLAQGRNIGEILEANAAPGYSEHHSGRALDLTTSGYRALEEEFERSAAFSWLQANAARFGFSLSYPRGNPHGIAYEPWHWRHDAARASTPAGNGVRVPF